MNIDKEPHYKDSENLVGYNNTELTEEEQKFIQKYMRWAYSRAKKRMLDKRWKEYDKKDDLEKENYVKQKLKDIAKRKQEVTKEITQDFIKQGKNVNHAGVWKSIQFRVKNRLIAEFGFNVENLEGVSVQTAKALLFPNFEKRQDKKQDTWIFSIPDEKLDPISKMQKHDPVKYVSTLEKLEQYREAKQKGRLGMYLNQYGEFQT